MSRRRDADSFSECDCWIFLKQKKEIKAYTHREGKNRGEKMDSASVPNKTTPSSFEKTKESKCKFALAPLLDPYDPLEMLYQPLVHTPLPHGTRRFSYRIGVMY
jgi:hypothetical protein